MTKFQDLNLNNAFLFAATAQDPEACRVILQSVLEREIPQVNVHAEHTVLFNSDYRMIRMDVYGRDALDVRYNIEMQNRNGKTLSKRARYHHAQMDMASLKPGQDFEELSPSYVIFICTFDPFGKGMYRYTFSHRCVEADLPLGDETYTIFFNTKGKHAENISEDLKEFLSYFENSTDEFADQSKAPGVKVLHEKVKQVKKDAQLEAKYMTLEEWMKDREDEWKQEQEEKLERVRAEVKAEGMAQGMAQGMAEGMTQGMAQGISTSVLTVLSTRFTVPEELREKIAHQKDASKLDDWLILAVNAASIEEFIGQITE